MSEGYSDYFACSALDDPRIGDYVANNQGGARNLASQEQRFPPGFVGEEHSTGEVWGCFLWDLRRDLGSEVSDSLALESLYFLDGNSHFLDGVAAVVAADRKLHPSDNGSGEHEKMIRALFDERRPDS